MPFKNASLFLRVVILRNLSFEMHIEFAAFSVATLFKCVHSFLQASFKLFEAQDIFSNRRVAENNNNENKCRFNINS